MSDAVGDRVGLRPRCFLPERTCLYRIRNRCCDARSDGQQCPSMVAVAAPPPVRTLVPVWPAFAPPSAG
jgi:hypothetical protein